MDVLFSQFGSEGRAYGYRPPEPDYELARCGPGTPGGELLRRFWQPVSRADELGELPKAIRILGEDLVLFRDRRGAPGLLYPRCMHRGTNLLFGKIEEEGIRCPYHGWLFDAQGRCLDAPCEVAGPPKGVRQPWYPVAERYGLLWAYLGPADKQPQFPQFSLFEDLGDDEELICGGGSEPPSAVNTPDLQDFNWWQSFENLMDPLHVYILHSRINGVQFNEDWALRPDIWFETRVDGVANYQHRRRCDGSVVKFTCQSVFPNINCSAAEDEDGNKQGMIVWHVPRDDVSFRIFTVSRVRKALDEQPGGIEDASWGPGKAAREWALEDHQRWQNDYTVLKGQGDIQLLGEQHLTICDRGISILRRLFRAQLAVVAGGGEPIGARRDSLNRIEVVTAMDPPPRLRAIAATAERPVIEST